MLFSYLKRGKNFCLDGTTLLVLLSGFREIVFSSLDEVVLFSSFEEIASFDSARLLPLSLDLGFGISVLTNEMFLALGANGTSPTILLGLKFPLGLEFLFGHAYKCSHNKKNSFMF